ncbi:hypothetical protein [Brevibacillus sp. SYSU BS000544]|uniref:hypothetical protein n=1 Tax=Brevibacillus sp. SYSU BS000544 TaxID=3416443 RepID=UPI003CE597E7
MADLIGQSQFKDRVRGIVQGDDATPDLWNGPYQDLINNDKFLNDTKLDKTEVAANGINKVPRLDDQGKGAFSITGDASSVGSKVVSDLVLQTEVAASGANKVPRLNAQGKGAFSITGDAASVGGKLPADLVLQTEVAANGASKVPRLDAQGKGAFSITGDAASVGGQSLTQLDARYSPAAHVGAGGNAHALATTSTAGFMGPDDKQRLIDYSEYASGKDGNGIYTVMDYKRSDGTLYMKSTLSNADASGNYQTMTWNFYNAAGTTIVSTKTWTLTYDADKNIVSKVVS